MSILSLSFNLHFSYSWTKNQLSVSFATTTNVVICKNVDKLWFQDLDQQHRCLEIESRSVERRSHKVFEDLNKKTVLKRVEDFLKTEKTILSQASLLIFKEKGGSEGKRRGRNDVPPKTFFPQTFKMSRKREVCHLILSWQNDRHIWSPSWGTNILNFLLKSPYISPQLALNS